MVQGIYSMCIPKSLGCGCLFTYFSYFILKFIFCYLS